jgi:hypothetical protein
VKAPILASLLFLNACSVNGHGVATTRVDHGDGAVVSSLYAPGLNIRTGDDSGLSLGMTKRVCIEEKTQDSPVEGWYHGRSPPGPECLSRDLTTGGIEVRSAPPEFSLTIGYKKTTIIANLPADRNRHYLVHYDIENPQNAIVHVYENGEPE